MHLIPRISLADMIVIIFSISNLLCIYDHDLILSSVSVLSLVDLIISSTRPRNLKGRSRTLRLKHERLNHVAESGLVRRSAS
jgi:hypothetical protein